MEHYIIIIFLVFIYLIYQNNNIKINTEKFANSSTEFSDNIISQVNQIYQSDIQSIKYLSIIAQSLTQSGGYNISNGLTISGTLNLNNAQINNLNVNGINISNMNNSLMTLINNSSQILNQLNNNISS